VQEEKEQEEKEQERQQDDEQQGDYKQILAYLFSSLTALSLIGDGIKPFSAFIP
jgi:hypothetical protein